jgi:hypothetical protein
MSAEVKSPHRATCALTVVMFGAGLVACEAPSDPPTQNPVITPVPPPPGSSPPAVGGGGGAGGGEQYF